MKKKLERETWLLVKYGAVGVLNTAVTAAAYALLRWGGVGIDLSYFLSYVAGILNSFVWNKTLVFRDREGRWLRQGLVFVAGAAGCWGVQWAVFRLLLTLTNEGVAYVVSLPVYPVINYLFNRLAVFRHPSKPEGPQKATAGAQTPITENLKKRST